MSDKTRRQKGRVRFNSPANERIILSNDSEKVAYRTGEIYDIATYRVTSTRKAKAKAKRFFRFTFRKSKK